VDDYPMHLHEMLSYLASDRVDEPRVVVLTPGRFNSAYFEHAFLAQQMGVELVQSDDLLVQDDFVYMRTTAGLERVDVIYRRVGDDYIDPEVFNPESMLGVRGLMRSYAKGNVALANAPGTGVADDKAIYAYIEKCIKYYLDEDPIIRNVPTYLCSDESDRKYVAGNDGIADLSSRAGGSRAVAITVRARQPAFHRADAVRRACGNAGDRQGGRVQRRHHGGADPGAE
jgi:uncharacterized circularly permuted ATP-grasp superfamily protein